MLLQWLSATAQHQILEGLLPGYCKIELCCVATCWHTALIHPLCWPWQLLHHANAINRTDFSNMNHVAPLGQCKVLLCQDGTQHDGVCIDITTDTVVNVNINMCVCIRIYRQAVIVNLARCMLTVKHSNATTTVMTKS